MDRDDAGKIIVRPNFVSWVLAVINLIVFALFLSIFDDAGLFEAAWGWFVIVIVALFLIGDFSLLRYVYARQWRKFMANRSE